MAEQWHRERFKAAVCRQESGLTASQRAVAVAFAEHARDRDHAQVSTPRLVQWTGLSDSTVRRAKKALERAGYLELRRASNQHNSTDYWIRIPAQTGHSEHAEPSEGGHGDHSETAQGGHGDRQGGHGDRQGGHGDRQGGHGDHLSIPHQPPTKEVDEMGAARSASYATELPVDQQEAVHDLVTRLQADERDAVDCVAHIVATKDLRRGVASYVASFRSVDDVTKNATRRRRGSSSANSRTLEDLQRWAGKPHSTARPAAPQTVLSRKGCPVCGHPLAADDGSCACPTPQERAS